MSSNPPGKGEVTDGSVRWPIVVAAVIGGAVGGAVGGYAGAQAGAEDGSTDTQEEQPQNPD